MIVHPELRVLPLRTPTLPPATHTNCYILGRQRLTLVDPATPWAEEQQALAEALEALIAEGARVERVVLTHHHPDHVGAAMFVRERFGAPILAHPLTQERLEGLVEVDGHLGEGDYVHTDAGDWEVLHTPGHARGHLCLYRAALGAVVAGDMIAGVGTIVLEPPEGELGAYLDSLARLRGLGPAVLFPAHGPDLRDPVGLLSWYIEHRHHRTQQLRDALARAGALRPSQLVEAVYGDTIPRAVYPIAARQVLCHLTWLQERGEVRPEADGAWRLSASG